MNLVNCAIDITFYAEVGKSKYVIPLFLQIKRDSSEMAINSSQLREERSVAQHRKVGGARSSSLNPLGPDQGKKHIDLLTPQRLARLPQRLSCNDRVA